MSSRRTDDSGGHESWIAFLEGGGGEDTEVLDESSGCKQLIMCPVVLKELLSNPKLHADVAEALTEVPVIDIQEGLWQRAGAMRAKVLARGRKARLGDALIAQSCIDAGIPLLTRDRDFRAFADAAGLDLLFGA